MGYSLFNRHGAGPTTTLITIAVALWAGSCAAGGPQILAFQAVPLVHTPGRVPLVSLQHRFASAAQWRRRQVTFGGVRALRAAGLPKEPGPDDGEGSVTAVRGDNASWSEVWSRNVEGTLREWRSGSEQTREEEDEMCSGTGGDRAGVDGQVNKSADSGTSGLFSTTFAFDSELQTPYWSWASLARRKSPISAEDAAVQEEVMYPRDKKNSTNGSDRDVEARLRREVAVLRLVLSRERSKTARLSEFERKRDAAATVAGKSQAKAAPYLFGPVVNFAGGVGGAIYRGAGAAGGMVNSARNTAVSTVARLGDSAKNQSQNMSRASLWQAGKNTTGLLWSNAVNWTNVRRGKERVRVNTVAEFNKLLKSGVSIDNIDVRGRSQPWRQSEQGEIIRAKPPKSKSGNISVIDLDSLGEFSKPQRGDGRSQQLQHPVLRAIWERKKSGSKPGGRTDSYKIALAIEGGGLRGSVTAGMSAAVMHLGVLDCFDVVLGSSAGSIVGTYLLGSDDAVAHRESTHEFFCNHLTTSREKLNGSSWLDMGRLVDLFTPDVSFSGGLPGKGGGSPRRRKGTGKVGGEKGRFAMMALDYPMKTIMQVSFTFHTCRHTRASYMHACTEHTYLTQPIGAAASELGEV